MLYQVKICLTHVCCAGRKAADAGLRMLSTALVMLDLLKHCFHVKSIKDKGTGIRCYFDSDSQLNCMSVLISVCSYN